MSITSEILWRAIERAARTMTAPGLPAYGWSEDDAAIRHHGNAVDWIADLEDRMGYDVTETRAAVLAYNAWDNRDAFAGLEDAVHAAALVEIFHYVHHNSEAVSEVMDRFESEATDAQCWREARMDMQKIAAWRLLRETRAEFGERLATELWEDLPYLSPRMVAMPWHNDTTAKLIATLTNGAEVWAWLESRHRDEREEYDGDRFAVYAYRDNAAALAGEPVWEDSSEEAGALWEMIENAIKAVKA